jgi:cysteinyl-tRNA synthetase
MQRESIPENLQEWVKLREIARKDGNFSIADTFRLKIVEAGWQVTDTVDGPRLEKRK